MAINPNVTFTVSSSALYTQMNRFPFGICQLSKVTTSTGSLTAETVSVTAISFTAIASRYYKITYHEPEIQYISGTVVNGAMRIRQGTTTAGTELSHSYARANSNDTAGQCIYVGTFSAGSVSIVATLAPIGSATPTINGVRASTSPAILLVEDLGPA